VFVTVSHFCPYLIFALKEEPTKWIDLWDYSLNGRLLALPTNIRLGWKCLAVTTNTLAYYGYEINHGPKNMYCETGTGRCYKTFYGRNLRFFHDKLDYLSLSTFPA
jgi:hypothetical protein